MIPIKVLIRKERIVEIDHENPAHADIRDAESKTETYFVEGFLLDSYVAMHHAFDYYSEAMQVEKEIKYAQKQVPVNFERSYWHVVVNNGEGLWSLESHAESDIFFNETELMEYVKLLRNVCK